MGFWRDLKKEWTWLQIKKNLPDFLSIVPAVFIADEFREKGFLAWACIWIATFIASKFILHSIKVILKRV